MTSSRLSTLGDAVDLVVDGFGTFGHADGETDRRQAVLAKLLSGQYEAALRIAACKTAEGGSRDVAANVTQEVLALADEDLSSAVERAG
jgi:hypothetical protein